jgi:hypothetical protein
LPGDDHRRATRESAWGTTVTLWGSRMGGNVADSTVRVETLEITESGNRQIASRTKASERRADIEAAVAEAADVVQDSIGKVANKDGWQVSRVEANFGIKLKSDAGSS